METKIVTPEKERLNLKSRGLNEEDVIGEQNKLHEKEVKIPGTTVYKKDKANTLKQIKNNKK